MAAIFLVVISDQGAYLNPQNVNDPYLLIHDIDLMDVLDPPDAPFLLVAGVLQGILGLLFLEGDHLILGEDLQHLQDIGHLHPGAVDLL